MGSFYRVVLVTAPAGTARSLARGLIDERLAACVNEVPGLTSHYRWRGKLRRDREVLLVIKTRASLFGRVKRFVRENHPAEVPELISLPILEGSRDYLAWLAQETK
ncbi:MAG: divalent-cation tolerance protein CutA [Elusimicrobia bacterium]|nr:divalent-cation tolerance protein CutA [Elusimicrobiota bacterium]